MLQSLLFEIKTSLILLFWFVLFLVFLDFDFFLLLVSSLWFWWILLIAVGVDVVICHEDVVVGVFGLEKDLHVVVEIGFVKGASFFWLEAFCFWFFVFCRISFLILNFLLDTHLAFKLNLRILCLLGLVFDYRLVSLVLLKALKAASVMFRYEWKRSTLIWNLNFESGNSHIAVDVVVFW